MDAVSLSIGHIPAMLWGPPSEQVYIFVHGKCGCKEEGAAFADIVCPRGRQVLSIDLPGHGYRKDEMDRFDPWHVVPELDAVLDYAHSRWPHVSLRANSIGAWFSMLSDAGKLENCLLVSPVLDMERLIRRMMGWAGVSEEQLERQQTIPTAFGETLSWPYYCYAREHPITCWDAPTAILYAGKDDLTERDTVDDFAARFHCRLTVMEEGEHWFHTPEQLAVLDRWTAENC